MRYDLGRVEVRKRNGLPHWDAQHGIYFVTFNLFDALPHHVRLGIRLEAEQQAAHIITVHGGLTDAEKAAIEEWVRIKDGESLDRTYGSCFMRDSRVAQIVADAITHFDPQRYMLLAWCVMPNHVHVVMENVTDLRSVIHSWKSFSAKRANALLGREGAFWASDYYDRCVRDERELSRTIQYVLQNPAKAGLHDWPFVWSKV